MVPFLHYTILKTGRHGPLVEGCVSRRPVRTVDQVRFVENIRLCYESRLVNESAGRLIERGQAGVHIAGVDRVRGEWEFLNPAECPKEEVGGFDPPTHVDLDLFVWLLRLQELPFLQREPTPQGVLVDILPIRFVGVALSKICREDKAYRALRNIGRRTKMGFCFGFNQRQMVDHVDPSGPEEVH